MTPYISVDLETTGLDHNYCQILEVGAVIEDWEHGIVEGLPQFHAYVIHDRIVGEAYALSMHGVILRRIAKQEAPFKYLRPGEVLRELGTFAEKNGLDRMHLNGAGKNFGSFDLNFLKLLPGYGTVINFKHRSIDAGNLYWNPAIDKCLPNTEECLKRAGIQKEVAHNAVEDSQDVVRLIRAKFNAKPKMEITPSVTALTSEELIRKMDDELRHLKTLPVTSHRSIPPITPFEHRRLRRNCISSSPVQSL